MPTGIYKRTKENTKSCFKKGHSVSEDVKEKIRKANLGNKNSSGCIRSEETKRKIREKRKYQIITEETRRKQREIRLDEKSHLWRGDDVKYGGLHQWVSRKLGKPTKCEHCNKEILNNYAIHWANKSGKYRRDLNDWIRLCVPCHSKYDNGKLGISGN